MRQFLITLIITSISFLAFAQEQQPNIVLFFVDDMGWADIEHRDQALSTPHLEQLRKESLEFTRAYIATPTCSPSRASLLTGKEPVRFQMTRHALHAPVKKASMVDGKEKNEFNLWHNDPAQRLSRNWLPLEEETYAEALKKKGYYNYFIGKWHLGQEPYFPIHQGFDAQYHTNEYGHPKSYYPPYFVSGNPFSDTEEDDYLTDVLTDEAERFIKTYDNDEPFMLTFWYFNVHSPHIGRKDWVEHYQKQGLKGKDAQYAAMVSAMDESVGQVREALTDKGIADNTIIIFLSDQGSYFQKKPLSGGKRGGNALGEGGARVPLYILYPNVTEANSTCDIPVQSIDIFPSLVEMAEGKSYRNKSIQGKSLVPLIKGEKKNKFNKRPMYFFRSYEDQYSAVIKGDWKMVKYHSGKFQLFNIKNDISESNNLIDQSYKAERTLKKLLVKWEEKAVPTILSK